LRDAQPDENADKTPSATRTKIGGYEKNKSEITRHVEWRLREPKLRKIRSAELFNAPPVS